MSLRSRASVAGLFAVFACLSACQKEAPKAPPSAPVPVTIQTLSLSSWNSTVQSIATVRARESVALTAAVSDVVERVHFESGDEVRAGQLLLTLRGNAQDAALLGAEASFVEADQLYRRQQQLVAQQLVAKSTIDTQRAIRDGAQARVAQMRAAISDRQVRAPFSGVLGIRQVSPGTLVTSQTVIATLDDISSVFVDFQVPEAQLAQVQLGRQVSGTVAAWPGEDFDGTVSAVDARVDEATRAITVRASFDNGDRQLKPGMLMDVRLYQPARQALVVPEIAVVQVGRESFVYRVKDDDTVERADVRVGERHDGKAEILEGVVVGERIVVDGVGKLRAGLKVRDGSLPAPGTPAAASAGQPK
ncbi:efflux RND transporter periplasmic adaptor subunit [Pseudoxanthomonas composti]|uniref:Efflux RND transporter periplasmic adaptor subunit n=1 Tax=Pseudoxanthomonas composti TaxID=2137479 RepID=A0A4Q1JZH3_9GAMM|nr:efflux RND transporter periplasmic adaptor subunit [Pseudoxanthomonas composti]RXR08750.1 efflux RND transporter periplasmic adaptor subunit [Pseudoxanthomonas composti]